MLKCAGQLNYLINCLNDCKPIIEKLIQSDKSSVLPFVKVTRHIYLRKRKLLSWLNVCGKMMNKIKQNVDVLALWKIRAIPL